MSSWVFFPLRYYEHLQMKRKRFHESRELAVRFLIIIYGLWVLTLTLAVPSKDWPQIDRNLPIRLGDWWERFSENFSISWAVNYLPAFTLFRCLFMTIKTAVLMWIISMMTLISLGVSFIVCLYMLRAWTNSTSWFDNFPTNQ